MKIISINTKSKNYNIYIGNNLISQFSNIIKKEKINFKKFNKETKNLKISSKSKLTTLVLHLKKLLEKKGFFVPIEKKQSMLMNINNLIYRLEPDDKEVRILASIISSLSKKNINRN